VVCTVAGAPTCTHAVEVDCARRGCHPVLDAGVLTITTRTGRERHAIVP